jgi:tryptophan-rich sensory protein
MWGLHFDLNVFWALAAAYGAGLLGGVGLLFNFNYWRQRYRSYTLIRVSPILILLLGFIIYTCLGISLYLTWSIPTTDFNPAFGLFCGQLVLNASWIYLFLGRKTFLLTIIERASFVLIFLLVLMVFWEVNAIAGALLFPYILWMSFAAGLNFSISQQEIY